MIYRYTKYKIYCISNCKKKPIDLEKTPLDKISEVAIQFPIYKEIHVVERLLNSVKNIFWFREKLNIQVIEDSTDETVHMVAQLVEELTQKGYKIEHIHRDIRKGHKASVLKEGLKKVNAGFIAIFDSDPIFKRKFSCKNNSLFNNLCIGILV